MVRYIPTLVGRFSPVLFGIRILTVHPHACGEIIRFNKDARKYIGTSPRLWGDFAKRFIENGGTRYIPTLVGRLPVCNAATRDR